jgi:hypothetical protein
MGRIDVPAAIEEEFIPTYLTVPVSSGRVSIPGRPQPSGGSCRTRCLDLDHAPQG